MKETLTIIEIRKALGYASAKELMKANNIKDDTMSRIKNRTPEKFEFLKSKFILNHFNVSPRELLDIMVKIRS